MKGIVLAGGTGSRLHPITIGVSKQLMPVYDKPMIYYPISTLMEAGIRDILIITTPEDAHLFKKLLSDGRQWGIRIEYAVQEEPRGIAQALVIGEEFIGDDQVALILGDNIFWSETLKSKIKFALQCVGATIFSYYVKDPRAFGVIEFNEDDKVISIEEKPKYPKSSYASVGLYVYDYRAVEFAKSLKPSGRQEYEITDLNNVYLGKGQLNCQRLDRGSAWLDTGTVESMNDAADFVKSVQNRQGISIACLEEIALKNGWIGAKEIKEAISRMGGSYYAEYLKSL